MSPTDAMDETRLWRARYLGVGQSIPQGHIAYDIYGFARPIVQMYRRPVCTIQSTAC